MFRPFALSLALLAAAPAVADSVSLTLVPRTAREAQVMRLALDLYAIHRGLESPATIRQQGQGNAAGLRQSGPGQWALIDQRGSGHQGTIRQTGQGNAWALFQSGRNTQAAVRQSGQGGVGITVVHGW
jgi:sarcosine oxidase gamma subunit